MNGDGKPQKLREVGLNLHVDQREILDGLPLEIREKARKFTLRAFDLKPLPPTKARVRWWWIKDHYRGTLKDDEKLVERYEKRRRGDQEGVDMEIREAMWDALRAYKEGRLDEELDQLEERWQRQVRGQILGPDGNLLAHLPPAPPDR